MHKVFVYGTLRKQGSRSPALVDSTLIGIGTTKGELYVDRYPVLTPGDNDVVGELYEVDDDTLGYLDSIEGVPTFYQRDEIEVTVDGKTHTAYAYRREPTPDAERVPSGDVAQHPQG
jgi:gamma-glutamylcyclotransferase (GGCT)/AIG2-like uncharacterized protein YtfP